MLTESYLLKIKDRVFEAVVAANIDAQFDHYAIKTPNAEGYRKLCIQYGTIKSEVVQSGRKIATVVGPLGNFEIMEPKENEQFEEPIIDHLGFCLTDLDSIPGTFGERRNRLHIGNTDVLFIKQGDNLLQFRSLPLSEYRAE